MARPRQPSFSICWVIWGVSCPYLSAGLSLFVLMSVISIRLLKINLGERLSLCLVYTPLCDCLPLPFRGFLIASTFWRLLILKHSECQGKSDWLDATFKNQKRPHFPLEAVALYNGLAQPALLSSQACLENHVSAFFPPLQSKEMDVHWCNLVP